MAEDPKTQANLTPKGAMFFRAGNVANELEEILGRCLQPLDFSVDEASSVKGAYYGTVAGRRIKVSSVVRSRTRYSALDIRYRTYQGFSLEFTVDTPIQTRFVLSRPPQGSDDNIVVGMVSSFLARRNGMRKMPSPHPDLDELRVWAFDAEWAERCLADDAVRGVLQDLRPYSSWSFGPGKMRLVMSPPAESITPDAVKKWLDGVVRLVTLAETKPTNVTAEKTRFEKKIEENPKALVPCVLLSLLGIPLALMLFFLVGWLILGEWVMMFPIIFMFFFMPYAMFLVFRGWFRQGREKLRQ